MDKKDILTDDLTKARQRKQEKQEKLNKPGEEPRTLPPDYDPWLAALEKTRYRVNEHGNLYYIKFTEKGGEEKVIIANFLAKPTREIIRDNGIDRDREFEIVGIVAGGQELPAVNVPAKDFPSLSWVSPAWGLVANVEPGQGCKDKVRHAIQSLAQGIAQETIYGHIGWRKIGSEWVYLYTGGVIGADGPRAGVTVDPGNKLQSYKLPVPAVGPALKKAVRASLAVQRVAPTVTTVPLLAAVCRAPLAEALPVDFSLFLAGATGAKKTCLTALVQAHFGAEFSDRNLPASWDSTANALEKLAFLAKDAVLVIDDFAPKGTANDVQGLHSNADRVLRAQGNLSGRSRMQSDMQLRTEYKPRGLIVSSGEDIPKGGSLRARGLILEVGPDDVNLGELTQSQTAAREGLFAETMAGYVKWLAPRMDELKKTLRAQHEEIRTQAREHEFKHDRTPDIIASLAMGLKQFLCYATEAGAMDEEEADKWYEEAWDALLAAGQGQAGHLASEEPTGRFLDLIAAALSSGKAHIANVFGWCPKDPILQSRYGWRDGQSGIQAQGDRIGWLDEDKKILMLNPDAAYATAQKLARDQNSSLPISQRVLWKRMAERGLILTEKDGKQTYNTVKRSAEGTRQRVLVLLHEI